MFTHYDTKGNANLETGGFGWLGVTQGHRHLNHL